MKKRYLSIIGASFFLISLILTLPASLVVKNIALDKDIKLGPISGVWWSFQVDWLSYQQVIQKNVAIEFSAWCLFKGTTCFNIHNDNVDINVSSSLMTDNVSIENSRMTVSFLDIQPFLKSLYIKPKGNIEFNISTLEYSSIGLSKLMADLHWHSVGVQSESFDLGTISTHIEHQPKSIRLTFSDQSELLDLSGELMINQTGRVEGDIRLKTLTGFPSDIKTVVQSAMKQQSHNVFGYKSKIQLTVFNSLGFIIE